MIKNLKKIVLIFIVISTIRAIFRSKKLHKNTSNIKGDNVTKGSIKSSRVDSEYKSEVKQNMNFLNSRQQEILEIIKTLGEVDMSKLSSLFEKVTDRTLRRDLAKLVESKIIEKIGDTKGALYKWIKG